ncbi:MAG TPA: ATP-binding cassette domain-containing protein [Paludibacteraceae bacterium]|jgi:molybdate transport system ATP-binding protein|nr:ATP-binding cassette domain-containing protein [Paludibacteraceae bacterium]
MKPFISLQDVEPLIYATPFRAPLNWQMNEGEIWSIVGKNGSGKSFLAKVIGGEYNLSQGKITYSFSREVDCGNDSLSPKKSIKIISFNSIFSVADFKGSYYQQRFNSAENELSPLVSDLFPENVRLQLKSVFETLNIEKIWDRRLLQLSSGELRKLLIAKALKDKPRLLVLDHPFSGLDETSRHQLDEFFYTLANGKLQLIFIVPSRKEMPACTSHVLQLENGKIAYSGSISSFSDEPPSLMKKPLTVDWQIFPASLSDGSEEVVNMNDIEISYGNRIINSHINWHIAKGEKWALLGPNGSGKSTLLSYIFADHPQAYSKDLRLFGRRRGTGESIWDIKKRIGFTSSEMHLYYRQNVSCLKVITSGFFDTIGLFRQCSEEQINIAEYLLRLLQIGHLKDRSFLNISSGEQRLVLFARALVKNPELLILDEPFHGLDDENKSRCMQIIISYCSQNDKTLIFVTHQKEEIPANIEHFMLL